MVTFSIHLCNKLKLLFILTIENRSHARTSKSIPKCLFHQGFNTLHAVDALDHRSKYTVRNSPNSIKCSSLKMSTVPAPINGAPLLFKNSCFDPQTVTKKRIKN